MILRTRRKNESLMKRLLKPWAHVPPPGHPDVLSPTQFEREVARERFRANRRAGGSREFAIVSIDFSDHVVQDEELEMLIYEFCIRLRISDTIGWHNLRLAVLLPETNKDGAYLVANGLVEIASGMAVDIQTEVSVYPWDDKLVSRTAENVSQIQPREEENNTEPPQAGHDELRNGSGGDNHEAKGFNSENNSYSRVDSAHGKSSTAVETRVALPKATKSKSLKASKFNSLEVEIAKRGTGSELSFLPIAKTPIWKRVIDVCGAGFGLVVLSPLLLLTAVVIKTTSSGPVFFKQKREGIDGKPFEILKFRTMNVDAEDRKDSLREFSEQDGPAFKLTNDPRVTWIGKYLRKSCIDELPQLLNVVVGEMSLVGPRPLPINESEQCLAWQRQRLSVLPGLTCIWQTREDRDTKFIEWMRMDMEYIRQRGFWFDMKLLLKTVMVVVMHRGSA